jgi:hypothetical protein
MQEKNRQTIIEPGGFIHSVFFWLKEPENQDAHQEFLGHLRSFIDASDYVKSKHIGSKNASDREVVDSDYNYSLIVTFNNQEEQDKYQSEPVHVKFVEDAQHLWHKVVVYDSLSIL